MSVKSRPGQLADDELLLIRVFDAPLAVVFHIWERPEHMKEWLGPKNARCTSVDLDFRVGGKWRACIESPEFGASWMGGEYREIEKDKRIVFTFAWDDGRDQPSVGTLVTVTFSEQHGKTIQSFHQTPFVHVEGRDSHMVGWTSCFDRQQTYVENLAKGAVS